MKFISKLNILGLNLRHLFKSGTYSREVVNCAHTVLTQICRKICFIIRGHFWHLRNFVMSFISDLGILEQMFVFEKKMLMIIH